MGIFRDSNDESVADEREKQREHEREQAAQQAALRQATEQAVHANPQFLRQLQDSDLDSSKFPELSDNLGPAASGANILGQRDETYEQEAKWGNMASARRVIKEGDPGRIAEEKTLSIPKEDGGRKTIHPLIELYHRTNHRDNQGAPEPRTHAERRAIRDAYDAITNQQSLSIGARGLRSLTEATAVTRSEGEEKKVSEKAAKIFD